MLKYTGHPLVDVGVATITAFVEKSDPAEVTENDLVKIADYIERQYSKNPMRSFLTAIFPNSGFTQPAFDKQPEKRADYARTVLFGWRHESPLIDERCVFFGIPAVIRAYRETIPLIGAKGGFNFYPEGLSGLPISGLALLAIQAFPLGCVKCSGRVLLMHAEKPELTYQLTAQTLEANLRYLNVPDQGDKYGDAKNPRTQIVERLLRAETARRDNTVCSITAYHLTNYGKNAAIDIYHLPIQITSFLVAATDAMYRQEWRRIVQRGWEGVTEEPERDIFGLPARRNVLYEDLFALPRDARRFLRTYVLRMPKLQKQRLKDDPRTTYSLLKEIDLVSWPLTELFLKEVMNVDKARIEAIRAMADHLADYIDSSGDQKLFRVLLYGGNRGQDYQELRTRLIRADYETAPQRGPLFTMDEFITVFENNDNQFTWMLARDLLLIRIIERLHERGKIGALHETISIPPEADDEEEQD